MRKLWHLSGFQTIRHRSKLGQAGLWGLAMNWATVLGCAGSWNCVTGGTGETRRRRQRYGNSHKSCWTKSVCLACCRPLNLVCLSTISNVRCLGSMRVIQRSVFWSVCLCGGDSPGIGAEEQPLKAFIRSWSKTSGLELLFMTTGRPELQLPDRTEHRRPASARTHGVTYIQNNGWHTHRHPHGNIITVTDNRTTTKQSPCVSSYAERSSEGNNL